ncbi:MAG TPA: DUF805 domain-containing protein [Galbitalea sp.]
MTNYQPQSTEVPLSAPYYGAPFGVAFSRFWKKYATFSGRASRAEYWWWALVEAIIGIVFEVVGLASGTIGAAPGANGTMTLGPGFPIYVTITSLWGLATIVPTLALTWRRLHDTNRSGGFFFLSLIPFVGPIIVFVFTLLPADPGGARFDR